MKIYIITAINDPAADENSYCVGAFTSLEGVAAQMVTFVSNRDVIHESGDVAYYDWGARYFLYDVYHETYFTLDVEETELDSQNIYI